MNKNLLTIKNNIGAEIMDTSSQMATRIAVYVNKRYFQVLRQIDWKNVDPDYSFSTVGGTATYALPSDFNKEQYVFDSTNKIPLKRIEFTDLARKYSDSITSSGNPERYCIFDDCVIVQPSVAGVVTLTSSSAGDNTQIVLVRGMNSSSQEIYEQVSLNGTTNVSTVNSFSKIKAISKSDVTVGTITVTSGATTLAVLPPSRLESRYKMIRFHYVPSSAVTISIPYSVMPMPLVSDYDVPVIDIADLLEIGARADALRYKKQYSKAQVVEAMFEKELQEYIWNLSNNPNEVLQFTPTVYNRELL